MDTFSSESLIDQASEKLLLSRPLPFLLLFLGFLSFAVSTFLLAPERVAIALCFIIVSSAILFQIVWMSTSNRWLLKNFLDVPVFELRKYDLATFIVIACCLMGSFYLLDTLVGLTPTEVGLRAYGDLEFIFQFSGVIYVFGYLAFSILAGSALIRSERSLNIYNTQLPIMAPFYMIPFFGIPFLYRRHVALVRRAKLIAKAQ